MKYWNDLITKEDLETVPGVIDQEKVRVLSMNLYLAYIEGCIELGGYEFPDIASEKMEDIMIEEFSCFIHATEGRFPTLDEITEHLKKPENIEVRKNWTYICVHANKENWTDIVKRIREEGNIPEEITLKNEEQINSLLEKRVKERTWDIIELDP